MHLRSEKLSGDKTTDLEVFKGFLKDAKKKELKLPEFFIHLRPTTPFRDIKILKKELILFLKNKRKIFCNEIGWSYVLSVSKNYENKK